MVGLLPKMQKRPNKFFHQGLLIKLFNCDYGTIVVQYDFSADDVCYVGCQSWRLLSSTTNRLLEGKLSTIGDLSFDNSALTRIAIAIAIVV